MEEVFTLKVSKSLEGQRIDRTISILTGCGRAQASSLIRAGRILINTKPAKTPSQKLDLDDFIKIHMPLAELKPPEADPNVLFGVVHEDADLLVIDKPAGLVIHPGAGNPDQTLVNGLLAKYPEIAEVGVEELRPGIVHRLDKDTSGLLLVARTQDAYLNLSAALKERKVVREYEAVCWGEMENPVGIIDAPVGRSEKVRTKMSIRADGKPAVTHYKVLDQLGTATYISCLLETGRTHQIRIHLSAIGHPIFGDLLYSGEQLPEYSLDRIALYSKRLAFAHPISGEEMEFSLDLPLEMVELIKCLRIGQTRDR